MQAKARSTTSRSVAGTRVGTTSTVILGTVVVIALLLLSHVAITTDALRGPTKSALTMLTGLTQDTAPIDADDAPIETMDLVSPNGGLEEEDPTPSNESLASLASSLQQARHDLGIDMQTRIDLQTPLAAQLDSLPRRLAGDGCTFSRCKPSGLRLHVVGNRRVRGLPFTYITVPFRNRLDNLARLVTSINNATTRAQRACMCIQVVDFETETSVIPSWKNKQCLASWDEDFHVYMDPLENSMRHDITATEISGMLQAQSCNGANEAVFVANATGESSIPKKYLRPTSSPVHVEFVAAPRQSSSPLKMPPVRRGFSAGSSRRDLLLPRHVDVDNMTGRDALRYVLAFFDGESMIVNGLKYLKLKSPAFSRAGGIAAGVAAIATPPESTVVFVCDADMVIRPGFFESMYRYVSLGRAVYYPICWSTCFGMPLSLAPDNSLINVAQWHPGMPEPSGYWRHYGTGMLAAFVSDFNAVGGYEDIKRRVEYGKEDGHLYAKFEAAGYRLERRRSQHLVHMYHSKIKDWANSADGMFGGSLGKLGAHVCDTGKFCSCPKGSTLLEIEAQLKAAAKQARKERRVDKGARQPA